MAIESKAFLFGDEQLKKAEEENPNEESKITASSESTSTWAKVIDFLSPRSMSFSKKKPPVPAPVAST